MGFTTRQIHAGVTPDPTTGAILTPIYQSTTFVQPSVDEYLSKGFSYSRSGNPTVMALQAKLTDLEGGFDCATFGTGMSAVHATMLAFLDAGAHAIISDVAYGGTYRLCTKVLSRFGPMYNAESMGGALSLCAMQVPPDRFDAVAAQVNAFAEVAHNYERDHLLNMWFVIATEHPARAAAVISDIEQQTGCRVYDMPKQEEFFIGLKLAV